MFQMLRLLQNLKTTKFQSIRVQKKYKITLRPLELDKGKWLFNEWD
jgi:hypothetical protein